MAKRTRATHTLCSLRPDSARSVQGSSFFVRLRASLPKNESSRLHLRMTYREKSRLVLFPQLHCLAEAEKGKIECSDCVLGDHTAIEGKDDGTYSCREVTINRIRQRDGSWYTPFRQSVEWFVCCLRDYCHLIASDGIYKAPTFDYRFRSDKDEVDFVHNICHGGIKDNGTRNTRCS